MHDAQILGRISESLAILRARAKVAAAFEALLGADNEIAFKLSFRIASILADTNAERSNLLKLLKSFSLEQLCVHSQKSKST
jgi:hypothetical protein